MTTAHTATPWRYAPGNGSPTTGRHMIAGAVPGYLAEVREYKSDAQAKADAEFIVRACNAYYKDQGTIVDLVKALQAVRKKLDELHYQSSGRAAADIYAVMGDCDAALAKAGAA